jgi:triosephosphate isomerase
MKNLIVANWKCNPTDSDSAERLFDSVKKEIKNFDNAEILICPPFVYLEKLKTKNLKPKTPKKEPNLKLGAQNCFWEERGAFTGEVSPVMLKNLGCNYVILGHSERRDHLGETDETILKKLIQVLRSHLKPILCIGEKKEEKGMNFDVLREQIKDTIGNLPSYQIINLVIAYEPVWAIGTGNNCAPNEAMTVLMFIKKELLKISSQNTVDRIPILYGGSINAQNAKDYIKGGFNGLLVGETSLRKGEFIKMIKNITNIN